MLNKKIALTRCVDKIRAANDASVPVWVRRVVDQTIAEIETITRSLTPSPSGSNIETAIQVDQLCDDHMRLNCVMVSDQKCDTNALVQEFCEEYGLPGLDRNELNDLPEITKLFVKFLHKNGFRPLKTKRLIFTD